MNTTTPASTSNTTQKRGTQQPGRGQARFAFIVLLIINILNYTDRSVLSTVLPAIQKDFHLTDLQLGWLSSSFLLIYGLTTLPLGMWADKGVRKNIVAICVTLWSLATALGGFTRNFVQLFLTRSVLGIGEAGYAPASLSLIGDLFPKAERGRMLSIWSTGNLFGTALGLIIGGHVAQAYGWRWAFYIVGIPGLIVAFLIWRATEPKRGTFDHQEQDTDEDSVQLHGSLGKGFSAAVKKLLATPTYWILVVAFICSFFIIGAALVWVPTYVTRAFSLSLSQASNVSAGVLGGGSLVGTLLGGWLADFLQRRLPQGRMLVTTIAFLVGAPLTWLALSMHDLRYFIVVFIVAIVCLSMCLGPIQAVIQDITTADIRSTAIGLSLLLGHLLGDAASPVIIGAISEKTSLGFALLITAPPCLFLAGIACLCGLRTVAKDMQKLQAHTQPE